MNSHIHFVFIIHFNIAETRIAEHRRVKKKKSSGQSFTDFFYNKQRLMVNN